MHKSLFGDGKIPDYSYTCLFFLLLLISCIPFWQEDDFKPIGRTRTPQLGYSAYSTYIPASTRYAALGAPTMYDRPSSIYGSKHGNTDIKLKLLILK